MTSKELKRLTRSDLLEILFSVSEENERLQAQIEEQKKQLEERAVHMDNAGSIAEAALRLNGVFEAAQAACDQYQQSVRLRYQGIEEHCDRMWKQTQEKCAQLERETKEKCEQMLLEADQQAEARIRRAEELAREANETFTG